MTDFQKRFQQALDNAGINCAELSRMTGISQGTLSNYKLGKYAPKQNGIYIIATALHVSPAWLMGYDEEDPPKTSDALLALYHTLSPEKQAEAIRYLRYLTQEDNQ